MQVNADCCGSTEYNPASQGCCNGVIYDLATQGCCGAGGIYDLATEECCGLTSSEPVQKGRCCNYQVLPDGTECCKKVNPEEMYDPSAKCCEDAGVRSKTVIANLDDCPNRVARDGFIKTWDGCGQLNSPYYHWIPNGFDFIVSFLDSCNTHDICYGNCSSAFGAKALCDVSLGVNMSLDCATQIPLPLNNPVLTEACLVQAGLYYLAVTGAGGTAWDDAQKAGCQCCP